MAGTVSNLLADVLIVATTSVAVEWWRRRRHRQSLQGALVRDLTAVREHLRDIEDEVRSVCEWSRKPRDASDVDRRWELLRERPAVRPTVGHGSPWIRLYASFEGLAAYYGMFDMSSLLLPAEAMHLRMQDDFKRAANAVSRSPAHVNGPLSLVFPMPQHSLEDAEAQYDPVIVETTMQQLHSTAAALRDALVPLRDAVDSIDPARAAAQRVPDALPRPITVAAIVLAFFAGAVWLGSYVYSHSHPETTGFAHGLTDNVLAGIIVVLVGMFVATIGLQLEWERRIRMSGSLAVEVSNTALRVASIVQCPDPLTRAEALSAVADFMEDCVVALQHVQADADLQGLVLLFTKRARQCLADGASTADFDGPSAGGAGVMTLYVPTPMGTRLVELASRIQARITQVYFLRSGSPGHVNWWSA